MKPFYKIRYPIGKSIFLRSKNLYQFKDAENLSFEINPRTLSFKIVLLLILITLNLSANLYAQGNIKFEKIGIKEGLSQASTHCIWQDSKGFIWIGTESGLNRYDGYSCILYTPDVKNPKSLSNIWVYSVYEDHRGNLWIGTDDGLNQFNREKETFRRYYHNPEEPNSLSNNKVYTIYEDKSGSLWFGTDNGLNKFNWEDETFKRYQFEPENPQSLSDNHIRSIMEDSSGVLWVGTDDGLNKFNRDEETWLRIQSNPKDPHSLSHNGINSICEDSLGMLWIGTDRGLNQFDPRTGKFKQYRHIPGDSKSLSDDWIHVVFQDHLGTLWIGTNEVGLNRFDRAKKEFVYYQNDPCNPYSLSSNRIYSIYEDRSGVIWVGTYGGALCKFNREPKRFRVNTHDPKDPYSLSHNLVRAFLKDQSGTLWVGTDGGGLNRYDQENDRFIHYRHNPRDPRSLSNDRVFSIVEDSSGIFWIGTYGGGLNKFDPKSGRFIHYQHSPSDPNSISDDRIRVICEGQPGVLWIGTDGGGLNKFETKNGIFNYYRHDPNDLNSLSSDRVFSILKSHSGAMWIATFGGGLNKFDPEKGQFTHYRFDPDDPNSLSNDYLITLHEDRSGMLWMGSNGAGLIKFDPQKERFSNYVEAEGLAGFAVYGILEDDEGYLWVSTNNGLSRFNPQTETFRNYEVNDGLQSNEFNGGSRYKSPKGEMFFGGINGFNRFYPEMIKDNPFPPQVVITNFKIFNKAVPIQEEENGQSLLTKSITEVEKISLSYKDQVISFEFAALHYASPEKNEYAYMMEGYEKDWNYVGNRRFVTYTNLPPKDYTFRVKGSNNDGVWNEEETSLKITITPPFWQTWWFLVSGITAILLLIFSVHQLRTHNIRERSKQLEERVEERTFKLNVTNKEVIQEIAERKRVEEALQTEKAYLDQLFESAQEAIVMVDNSHRVLRINSEFVRLFGYTSEEAVGRLIDDLVASEDYIQQAASYSKQLTRGEGIAFESIRRRKDGTLIDVSVIGSPIKVRNEQVAYYAIYRDITKRKRAEEAIKRRKSQLELVHKIQNDIPMNMDIETILISAAESIGKSFGYHKVSVNLFYKKKNELVYIVGWNKSGTPTPRGHRQKIGEGLIGKAAQSKRIIIANDVSKEPSYVVYYQTKTKAELSIPLLVEDHLVGVLDIQDIKKNAFTKDDISILQSLANYIAYVIEEKEKEEDLKRRAAQAGLINKIGQRMSSKLELDALLSEIVSSVRNSFNYYGVMMLLLDKETKRLTLKSITGGHAGIMPIDLSIAIGEGIIGYAAASGKTQVSNNVSKDSHYVRKADEKTKSELSVAIKRGEKVIGVLDIQSDKFDAFDETDVTAMETLGTQIATAIENARLYEQAQQEINDRKQAEKALRIKNCAIESSINAIAISNLEGNLTYVNPSFLRLWGYDNEKEVLGKPVAEFWKKGEKAFEVIEMLRDKGNWIGELVGKRKDDLFFDVHLIASMVTDEAGKPICMISSFVDITERKRTEGELKQTLTELKRSNRELEQFAYLASHDLQEPLRMVSSYTQLLARRYKDKLDADANEFIGYAVNGATRMQTLINDLLAYSRVSTRGEPFEPSDCETVLEKALANLEVAIEESGAVITHDPLPIIMFDASQLIQVFQNLIENAIKFRSEEPPRVHISAEQKRNEWIFSVRDNGIGIDPQYKERIFVIFNQLHIKGKYPGTGIGLAICKKIVEHHSGRIWVESKSRKGSTFYFTVPMKGGK